MKMKLKIGDGKFFFFQSWNTIDSGSRGPPIFFQNLFSLVQCQYIKISLTWVHGLFSFVQFKNFYLAIKIGLALVHWLYLRETSLVRDLN